MLPRLLAAALAIAALQMPRPAAAQETSSNPEARQHLETGNNLADQGDWASALREFQAAYASAQGHPRQNYVLYNIARAYEELRQTQRAIETYEQYLSLTADDSNAPNRDQAERHLRELRLRAELEGGGASRLGFPGS